MKELALKVTPNKKIDIAKIPTGYQGNTLDKKKGQELLKAKSEELSLLQDKFYADGKWSLLIILQGMDASGKDSCVKRIFTGINPQGVYVYSFKAPTDIELKHDFLWRCVQQLPEQGKIGIFNRSYYEELLVVRNYPPILASQNLPKANLGKDIWKNRMNDMNHFETYLSHNATKVIKFYLHLSKKEQAERLLERAMIKEENWKVGKYDLGMHKDFDTFIPLVNEMLQHTSTEANPWYLVPADNKWYTHLLMMNTIIHEMKKLDFDYPKPTDEQIKAIQEVKTYFNKK